MHTVYQQAVHKQLSEILKGKYQKNGRAIERVAAMLLTKQDVEEFLSLATDLYKVGFDRATESYKEQLTKLGYQVKVSHPNEGV